MEAPLNITIKVPAERIAYMMLGAIETSRMTRAWCKGVAPTERSTFAKRVEAGDFGRHWYADPKAYEAGLLIDVIEFDETAREKDKVHRVNSGGLRAGLRLMAEKYPWHFANMLAENDDEITHDVFLQCIALKDLVYG
jgi:hypothetical protein